MASSGGIPDIRNSKDSPGRKAAPEFPPWTARAGTAAADGTAVARGAGGNASERGTATASWGAPGLVTVIGGTGAGASGPGGGLPPRGVKADWATAELAKARVRIRKEKRMEIGSIIFV